MFRLVKFWGEEPVMGLHYSIFNKGWMPTLT